MHIKCNRNNILGSEENAHLVYIKQIVNYYKLKDIKQMVNLSNSNTYIIHHYKIFNFFMFLF